MTARVPDLPPGRVRPSRFSHLVIQSPNHAAMVAWYKTVLQAEAMFENPVVSFLTFDDEHHRVMIGHNPNAKPRDPECAGVVHFAYSFDTLAELVDAYERLKGEGIVPGSCINHGFTTSLYYRDPDQNEVELAVDNFDNRDDMNAWFETGAFDRNFVGVSFDPDEMAKRFHEGVPIAEIHGSYE